MANRPRESGKLDRPGVSEKRHWDVGHTCQGHWQEVISQAATHIALLSEKSIMLYKASRLHRLQQRIKPF